MKTTNLSLKRLVILPTLLLALLSSSFAQESPIPLSVTDLINFSGKYAEGGVNLECKLAQDHTLTIVYVERATGDNSFERIAEINVAGTRGFHFNDNSASKGKNLYRLALTKTHGNIAYSKILKIDNETVYKSSLQVYPTLVSGSATLSVSSDRSYKGTIQIADMSGRILNQRTIAVQPGTMVTELQEVAGLKPGNYIVVLNSETDRLVQRIIVK